MNKILIIGDGKKNARNIKIQLENLGYHITDVVSSGEKSLESITEKTPDLILIDIKLNGKLEGIKTAQMILDNFNIPVIYLSNCYDEEIMGMAKKTAYNYIIKPFHYKQLHAAIKIAIYQHKRETKLKYLTMHDPLTNLYNRSYFEEEIFRLSDDRFNPVSVILCDLNGLKLINDSMGHQKGDYMLKAAANILKRCFRKGDVVARLGGDEFAVLLPKCDYNTLKNIHTRIKDSISQYNKKNMDVHLSMSLGLAVKKGDSTITESLLNAEKMMYKDKLSQNEKVKINIIKNINKILQDRNITNISQIKQLEKISVDFCRYLRLSSLFINRIRLLSKYQDIGMVAISKDKPLKSAQNNNEIKDLKLHPEIGYRIAVSSSKLNPISDLILKHHECWNGKGYPLGLKKDQIPLECRIIAIINVYHAMTTGAPHKLYKNILNHSDAILELKKLAGIEFDPKLVKKFVEMVK